MRKIRIGNDFTVLWKIERDGEVEDLTNITKSKLECCVVGEENSLKEIPHEIIGLNTVRTEITPQIADKIGRYYFILSYEFDAPSLKDGDRKCKVDTIAFYIVPLTATADEITQLEITSDVLIGLRGRAFVYDDFTPEQIADLKQPAIDAGLIAKGQGDYAQQQGDYAKTQGTRAKNATDNIDISFNAWKTQEADRVASEVIRESNESNRVDAEGIRVTNEIDRKSKESDRVSNESDRELSETERRSSEIDRNNTEIIRESNEDLRKSNEVGRVNAESDRVDAEITREQQESERQTNTATAITNAENAITDVNAAKDDYYDVVKPAIQAQGVYAIAQGDYAKEQGEAVDGRISVIEDKVDKNIGWYGVEWSTAIASSSMTRIGSMNLHRELPVQNKMKGVLLNDDGTVNKYLDENDWTSEVRDGTQGQVMVEMPEFYYKFEANGNIRRMLISDYALTGFEKMPKMYISAYEASLNGSNLSSEAGVMAKTSYSRTNFRSSARNRGDGWEMYFYNAHKSMLMLYFVEYANRNSQLNFNAQLTESGFKQGGLGAGVTTVISGEWSSYNGYNPFLECGFTDTLGNNTGVVTMDVPFGSVPTVDVPRYRGIENPFGHIWKNCDGINIDIKTDEDGGTSTCYICDDPAMFSDSSYEGYTNVGLLARSNGYINEMLLGEFMPASVGGGSTTYWADQFYTSITSSSLRTVLWGGACECWGGCGSQLLAYV